MDVEARREWARKHPNGDPTGRAAQGSQAKRAAVKALKWMRKNGRMPWDTIGPVAAKAMRCRKRRGVALLQPRALSSPQAASTHESHQGLRNLGCTDRWRNT